MVSEVKEGRSPSSWWCDSHSRSHQSEWLQTTISDLDKKTKLMLSIIEDDGVSFAKRAEMFYNSRPELIKMVEDLHKSYRLLAQNYDHLKSSSIPRPFLSPPGSFRRVQHLRNSGDMELEASISHPQPVAEDPGFEAETSNFDLRKNSSEKKIINGVEHSNFGMPDLERKKMWDELQLEVTKLMEENLRQQAELIRRNDEKREAIKELFSQIKKLMDENRALRTCLATHRLSCTITNLKHQD
ncbi:protein NETWORKED 3C-like [Corylus avellana]|uniref:protein NETWORKED 3C-like n=1 Tax=Corylus avellana TaxID=13451 RepID=UPI00286BFFCD|nr:protein NETWORKED 3C-like [Corylus avellana]